MARDRFPNISGSASSWLVKASRVLIATCTFGAKFLTSAAEAPDVPEVSPAALAPIQVPEADLRVAHPPVPQKQNEKFRFIRQERRRLSSLIENVLAFSRIEQGRKEYEFAPTDLVALPSETVK